jgi:hypothetical protein
MLQYNACASVVYFYVGGIRAFAISDVLARYNLALFRKRRQSLVM